MSPNGHLPIVMVRQTQFMHGHKPIYGQANRYCNCNWPIHGWVFPIINRQIQFMDWIVYKGVLFMFMFVSKNSIIPIQEMASSMVGHTRIWYITWMGQQKTPHTGSGTSSYRAAPIMNRQQAVSVFRYWHIYHKLQPFAQENCGACMNNELQYHQ